MTTATLIVLVAFDRSVDGRLRPAFEPIAFETELHALRVAQALGGLYDGVVVRSRDNDLDAGKYHPPSILFQSGDIPDYDPTLL